MNYKGIILAITWVLAANTFSADESNCSSYNSSTEQCAYQQGVAVQYALNNWNFTKNDSPFPYYNGASANCTNFVSQAILAGLVGSTSRYTIWNVRQDYSADSGSGSHLEWFFNSSGDRGPAWTGAEKMYEYAVNNNASYKGLHFNYITHDTPTSFMEYRKVKEGDVIFVDWTGDGTIDHTMIVTQYTSLSRGYNKIRVSYQTEERQNKLLGKLNEEQNYQALFYVYRPTFYSDYGL